MSNEATIAALLRERQGYVNRGLGARVAHVDDELRKLGHKPPRTETVKAAESVVERAVAAEPVETAAAVRRGRPPRSTV